MANIQLLNGTEKIKDSYGKINTSLTNLNNAKMEKTADSDLNMNNRNIQNVNKIGLRDASTLTISNGAITVTQSYHQIDTEGGAPLDELTTINGGNTGDILIIKPVDSNRDILIKGNGDNGGNIFTYDRSDILMNTITSVVMLVKTATGNWYVVGMNAVPPSGGTFTGNIYLGATTSYQNFIRRPGSDMPAYISLDFEGIPTASASVALFRNHNSSGLKEFVIFRGDGTNTSVFRVANGVIDRLNGISVTITAYAGNPNGNVAAPPGSICLDTANGVVYRKASGTGNTGWQAMS